MGVVKSGQVDSELFTPREGHITVVTFVRFYPEVNLEGEGMLVQVSTTIYWDLGKQIGGRGRQTEKGRGWWPKQREGVDGQNREGRYVTKTGWSGVGGQIREGRGWVAKTERGWD